MEKDRTKEDIKKIAEILQGKQLLDRRNNP
jgi:hypothetical protein